MDDPTRPQLNRELIASDLQTLAELGGAQIEAAIPAMAEVMAGMVRTSPLPLGPKWLRTRLADLSGKVVSSRLQGSVAPALSQSFLQVLELSDEDLSALLDGIGAELGAWAGYRPALTADQLGTLRGPLGALFLVAVAQTETRPAAGGIAPGGSLDADEVSRAVDLRGPDGPDRPDPAALLPLAAVSAQPAEDRAGRDGLSSSGLDVGRDSSTAPARLDG